MKCKKCNDKKGLGLKTCHNCGFNGEYCTIENCYQTKRTNESGRYSLCEDHLKKFWKDDDGESEKWALRRYYIS